MSDPKLEVDLREQVARLLYAAFASEDTPAWGLIADARRDVWLIAADSLLPLFASRERAAAEKGWAEGREGAIADHRPFLTGFDHRDNPYLAQREESPNAE